MKENYYEIMVLQCKSEQKNRTTIFGEYTLAMRTSHFSNISIEMIRSKKIFSLQLTLLTVRSTSSSFQQYFGHMPKCDKIVLWNENFDLFKWPYDVPWLLNLFFSTSPFTAVEQFIFKYDFRSNGFGSLSSDSNGILDLATIVRRTI